MSVSRQRVNPTSAHIQRERTQPLDRIDEEKRPSRRQISLRRLDLELPRFRRRYQGLLPFLHLDYAYYEHTLRARDALHHGSRKALMASDDLPLVADFEL